jgi:hypothetical protein
MRCPYCSGLNPDRTAYCVNCGRDMTTNRDQHASQQAPRPFSQAEPPHPQQQRLGYPSNQPQQRPTYPSNQPQQRPTYPSNQPQQRPTYPPNQPQQRPAYPSNQPQQRPAYPPVQSSTLRPATTPAPSRPNVATTRTGPARVAQPTPPLVEPVHATEPVPSVPFPPKTIKQLQALGKDGLEYKEISQEETFGKKKLVYIQFRQCTGWQQVATLLKALAAYDNTKYNTVIIQGVYNQESSTHEYTNGQLIFDRNVRLGSQLQNRYQIETDNGYSTGAQRIVLSE